MSDLVMIGGCIPRGSTVRFATIFKDFDCQPVAPVGAQVHLVYVGLDGLRGEETVTMTAPVGENTRWTALWDSRKASPGAVSWSIQSLNDGIPYAVQDGKFTLAANQANISVTP